jgi:hypothetical protein
LWWTADPPRPFQLRPVPICSALRFLVAGLLPAFIYRRAWRLSQGTAYSFRVTLMVRPLLLAEPGPGDASCTIWTLSVFFRPLHLQAGRPSSSITFRSFPVLRPLPTFLSSPVLRLFPIFLAFRPLPIFPSSSVFQPLQIFRLSDLLRPFGRSRPSCDSNLSVGGTSV